VKFSLEKHRYTAMVILSVLILVGSGISLGVGLSESQSAVVIFSPGGEGGDIQFEKEDDRVGETILGKIDINTASADELELLPGIGPAYAERIVDYRIKNGFFLSTADIQNISGIGPKTFEKIKDLITVK
jgi:competence protein ComEA